MCAVGDQKWRCGAVLGGVDMGHPHVLVCTAVSHDSADTRRSGWPWRRQCGSLAICMGGYCVCAPAAAHGGVGALCCGIP